MNAHRISVVYNISLELKRHFVKITPVLYTQYFAMVCKEKSVRSVCSEGQGKIPSEIDMKKLLLVLF